MNTNPELDEILQTYFREVVDKAVEQHGESIVEFAERSKAIRERAKQALLTLQAKAVRHGIMDCLLRINEKAMVCARTTGTGFEELSGVYDKAVMKEIADLTDEAQLKANGEKDNG